MCVHAHHSPSILSTQHQNRWSCTLNLTLCLTIFFITGNLKHKDLSGHVVSSQVYDNGNDDINREAENLTEAEPRVLSDDSSQRDDGN